MTWGMWILKLVRSDGGDPARVKARSAQVGLDHVVIKITDGTSNFNGRLLKPVFETLRQGSGLALWVWTYTYGRDPEGEAEAFGTRALALQADGMVVDLEGDRYSGNPAAAKRFMTRLRQITPEAYVGLSSHRFPSRHRDVPIADALAFCDVGLPQAYYLMPNVEDQTQRVFEEWSALGKPVAMTGAAFPPGTGDPANIGRFVGAAQRAGVERINWFDYESATPAMWDEIAAAIRGV